jgi:hypothetical protein
VDNGEYFTQRNSIISAVCLVLLVQSDQGNSNELGLHLYSGESRNTSPERFVRANIVLTEYIFVVFFKYTHIFI